MTDIKKKEDHKNAGKLKKLRFNKETLKDLSAKDATGLKGGAAPSYNTGCTYCDYKTIYSDACH